MDNCITGGGLIHCVEHTGLNQEIIHCFRIFSLETIETAGEACINLKIAFYLSPPLRATHMLQDLERFTGICAKNKKQNRQQ